jgi:GNAT superfamily N-acetyltransferase
LRIAFGTFFGVPEPEIFWSDRDYVYSRWRAQNVAAFGATSDGRLAGSNFASRWGSVGFLGPITVRPDLHERGIAKALLDSAMTQFDTWGATHTGLFTFAHSAKHVSLYQKFGFYPRFLTALMVAPVPGGRAVSGWSRFSTMTDAARAQAIAACREVSESIYPGLDLTDEIREVDGQGLGDTVLIEGAKGIAGFAICHHGPRSEAGAGTCAIKFGAVRDTPSAAQDYSRLLDACEAFAAAVGIPALLAGANLARREAYEQLVARGYRASIQGVAMHRHNDAGYCCPGAYVIDDWR